ncbi:mitochondrial phosphate carrier protein 1, mitochondrial isoform X2 [Mercurialis annua]|uniref:mitochondrial phosphate carrier protein 1, mitochondrial isoform X2 n=1 Tax=Mercurialis annua TaxID=3986 RepID=UPI00215E4FDA|nr:mitochondrial phosphate carrier protein 1, mitochondrial isoform X2 [Mercurialis annua]
MVTLEQQPLRINEDYNYNAAATAKYYFGFCAVGGMLSAGTTHLVMTPLDVLKVNMQVNPVKYNSICSSYKTLLREHGPSAFWRGWAGKFIGYGVQGGCRFGLYEYFKSLYSNVLPHTNRSLIFFISSASAEVFANLGLCPFEAIKVKVQAQPHFAKGLSDGFPRLYASEGLFGFYRGLVPLFGRNLPFCTVMFSTFEHSADLLYRKVMQRRKEDCTKAQQLGVTCMAGYAAGSVGSFVSNPADNIVSCLYNGKADNVIMAIKKIGISNLFTRSLPIRIMLVGPAVTLQWLFYDTFKVFSGLSASGEVRSEVEIDGAN